MVASLARASVALLAFRVDAMQLQVPKGLPPLVVHGEMVGHVAFSTVTKNNLGGMGPTITDPEQIFFEDMGSAGNGEQIDMKVTNTSEYTPGPDDAVDTNGRGKSGTSSFVSINVACGTYVNLLLSFTVNGIPAFLDNFYLTLSDLDSDNTGLMHEYFGVFSPYQNAYLGNDSELNESAMDPVGRKWVSTKPGRGSNNPNNPNSLTPDEQTRAVTVEFVNTSSVSIVLGVTPPPNGVCDGARNMMFALRSNMVPYDCNTCALAGDGRQSCCASGGSWSGQCGNTASKDSGKKYFSWEDGFEACVTPSPTPKPTESPTVSPTPSPTEKDFAACGTCVIWGDPHVITFEAHKHRLAEHPQREEFFRTRGWKADQMTINEDGIYWLVKSDMVHIQGRYFRNETADTTSLQELAIGGPFLKDKVLLIQSLEGKVMWGGEEILASINSEFQDSLIQAKYHQGAKMVKDGTLGPGVDVFLPTGVDLTVNRWRNGLAAEINMCPVNAVGGQCRGPVNVDSMY
jgi:hypothetical protein